jgi:hypothetical protein
MRFPFSVRSSLGWCLGISLLVAGPIFAQPPVNKDQIKKAYNDVDTRRRELNNGNAEAKKADQKVAEAVAHWHIYRAAIKSEKTDLAQFEFNGEISAILDKKNANTKRAYINLLGPACVSAMKQVLAETDIKLEPTMVIHAAQLLPIMARLKQDDVANYLIQLIEDPKTHDVIRLHALKAMKEMMPIRVQLDPVIPDRLGNTEDYKDNKYQNPQRAHDARNVNALAKYIERYLPNVQNMPPDDLATLRYLRREAIVALAAAGAPAVTAHEKAPKKLDGLVAPTLMKVLAKNAVQPPTSMNEKIEAAIGLCNMEYPWMTEYRPEIAIHLVGRTLVEFTNEYNKDLPFFTLETKGKQPPYIGFKTDGKRFEAALKKLEENAKPDPKVAAAGNPAAVKMASELRQKSKILLDAIVTYRPADAGRLEDFTRFVEQIRPKSGYPFKTLKSPEIPLN